MVITQDNDMCSCLTKCLVENTDEGGREDAQNENGKGL